MQDKSTANLRTFTLKVPESVMFEVIEWSDRQQLGLLPERIALFIAELGNIARWDEAG